MGLEYEMCSCVEYKLRIFVLGKFLGLIEKMKGNKIILIENSFFLGIWVKEVLGFLEV